ncbi:MAG: thiamine phosphate synthase [Campylobacterales bacterium]|nr:thiamine phosphate synthase [Campylobacterales bacterium]
MQLYALCDQTLLDERGVELEEFVHIAVSKGATMLQYRHKSADIAEIKSRLITLRALYDGYLIVNDHYELVSYCDGVHIGQEDLREIDADPKRAVTVMRSIIGSDKILGLSTHSAEEIEISNTLDVNYIGLGAYRDTATKQVGVVLGDRLDVLAKRSLHPVAAIGGVRLDDRFEHVRYLVIARGLLED